ncbi:hypothetical protein Dimus_039685 [Dionaea muscipula]
MAQRLQAATDQRVDTLVAEQRRWEEEKKGMEEILAQARVALETSQREVLAAKEWAIADAQAATAEQERLKDALAQAHRSVAQLEELRATEVERVKGTHFEAWRETWLDSEDGRAYIDADRAGDHLGI